MSAHEGTISGYVGDHLVFVPMVVITCDFGGCEDYFQAADETDVYTARYEAGLSGWLLVDDCDYCGGHSPFTGLAPACR